MGMTYKFSSDVEEAHEIIETMIKEKPDLSQALIIFDDFNDTNSRNKGSPYNKLMSMCYAMLRNYYVNNCILTQSFNNVPPFIRLNSNVMLLWQMSDIYSIRASRETVSLMLSVPISYKGFMEVYKLILKNIHAHIIVSNKHMYVDLIDDNPPEEVFVRSDKEIIFKGKNLLNIVDENADLDEIVDDDENLGRFVDDCEMNETRASIRRLNTYINKMAKVHNCDLGRLVECINKKYDINLKL
jgi:hypothetical protein